MKRSAAGRDGSMMNVKELIRSKSQTQWRTTFQDWLTNLRIFVQENGEKALVIGFALGIFIVIFFKLFIFILCIAVLAYLLIMAISEPANVAGQAVEPALDDQQAPQQESPPTE